MSNNSLPGGDELALLATAIALVSAKVLTTDQLNVYGNLIVAIGSLMLTIAAQDELLNKLQEPESDTAQQIKEIQQLLTQLLKEEPTSEQKSSLLAQYHSCL